jgi:hypothetical protein
MFVAKRMLKGEEEEGVFTFSKEELASGLKYYTIFKAMVEDFSFSQISSYIYLSNDWRFIDGLTQAVSVF